MERIDKIALMNIALLQISMEYTDELASNEMYGRVFTHSLKNATKNYIKHADKLIDAISKNGGDKINEQIFQMNKVLSEVLDSATFVEPEKVEK